MHPAPRVPGFAGRLLSAMTRGGECVCGTRIPGRKRRREVTWMVSGEGQALRRTWLSSLHGNVSFKEPVCLAKPLGAGGVRQ